MAAGCPHHQTVTDTLNDHEDRLRSKRDRILSLEKDVENMNEKLDLIVTSQKETRDAIHASDIWQTRVMTVFAVVMFLVQIAPAVIGWVK